EPAGEDEAGRDQSDECDGRGHEVEKCVPADGARLRHPRWKTVDRVRDEDPSRDQTQPVQTDQQRSPGPAPARSHRLSHADGATEDEQTGNQEARNLDPDQITDAHQAQLMPADVETRANQDFDHANPHVKWAGDHATNQQRSRRPHGWSCHQAHRPFSGPLADAVTGSGCEKRMWLPNGSRSPQSMPYGRSVGSSVNSTPFARSSSYVPRQSSVVKKRWPPARPFVTRSRTCAAVLSSMFGGPGRSSRIARSSSPGTATVSQRMNPRS